MHRQGCLSFRNPKIVDHGRRREQQHKMMMSPSVAKTLPTVVLFGKSEKLSSRRKYQSLDDDTEENDDLLTQRSRSRDESSKLRFLLDYFFGFMLEEDMEDLDENDELYRSMIEPSTPLWNPLHRWLSLSLLLLAASSAVPVAMAPNLLLSLNNGDDANQRITTWTTTTVLGTALGKLLLGPLVDVVGARRCLVFSGLVQCAMQLLLVLCATSFNPSDSSTTTMILTLACTGAEFAYAMVWPAVVVLLATHHRGKSHGQFQGGLYLVSLASRLGSLLGLFSLTATSTGAAATASHTQGRIFLLASAWMALVACSICYLHIVDAPPETIHSPQNPLDPVQVRQYRQDHKYSSGFTRAVAWSTLVVKHYKQSLQHVWGSGTFWIMSLAHTGASTVRTCDRVVGTFLRDMQQKQDTESPSSNNDSSSSCAALVLSLGIFVGLVVVGHLFSHSGSERQRKYLVSRGYLASIAACYSLSATSLFPYSSEEYSMVWLLQVASLFVAGVGISVPLSVLPSLVGATYGCDKGLFSAHVDGVGYAAASLIWHVIHHVSGWAYAWAAVALLLIVSGLAMSEFMEHYFCRKKEGGGTYETIIFA